MRKTYVCSALSLLATGLLLTGCATPKLPPAPPIPTAGTEPRACEAWKALTFDRLRDTVPTIEEIKANNARQRAYCSN